MKRQLRPTLVVGLGRQGAAIARLTLQEAALRLAGTPAVRAIALLDAAEASEQALFNDPQVQVQQASISLPVFCEDSLAFRQALSAELEFLYSLDLLQTARTHGWEVKRAAGAAIFLVAAPVEPLRQTILWSLVEYLHGLATQHIARQTTLTGVLLSPESLTPPHSSLQGWIPEDLTRQWQDFPFTEGCYVLQRVNAYGLALTDPGQWHEMVARWILEMIATPLGAGISALPSDNGAVHAASFGLACWKFPGQLLADALSARMQRELLEELLAPAAVEKPAIVAAVRERCKPPPLWLESNGLVALEPQAWTHPALSRLQLLPADLAAAGQAVMARLESTAQQWQHCLDAAVAEGSRVLEALLVESLDTPASGNLARGISTLLAIREILAQESEAATAAAMMQLEQRTAHETSLAQHRQVLEATLTRFPAWTWHAWLHVLRRPNTWFRLARRYHEIARSAAKCAEAHTARWLATHRAYEASWLAAYYQELDADAADLLARLRSFQGEVQALAAMLASLPQALSEVRGALERAALPATLIEYLYLRYAGVLHEELQRVLTVSGPLSVWVLQAGDTLTLQSALAEHAFEHFEALLSVRLDDYLVRSYSSEELRARLTDLLEAAGPFWMDDPAQFEMRAWAEEKHSGAAQYAWVGLAQPDDSQLVDLLPERAITCYATGEPGTITAVQVRLGIPL